jgi:hypothetical protein
VAANPDEWNRRFENVSQHAACPASQHDAEHSIVIGNWSV